MFCELETSIVFFLTYCAWTMGTYNNVHESRRQHVYGDSRDQRDGEKAEQTGTGPMLELCGVLM